MKTLITFISVLSIIFSVNAFGGAKNPLPVFININEDGSFYANGDMWTARSDKSDTMMIGCGVKHFSDGYAWGFCQADDGNDQYVVCITEDPELLEAVYAINDSSFIQFAAEEFNEDWESFVCNRIDISSQSFYVPLTTTKGSN